MADAEAGKEVAVHPVRVGALREVFVDFFVADEESLVFVEHADQRLSCTRLPVGAAEIAGVVEAMRRDFDGAPGRLGIIRDRPERVSMAAVDALGRRLLPFADELRDADVVCIFPHGPLHNFPLQAVRLGDGRLLAERCAVVSGLSRRLLAVARAARGAEPGVPRRPASALVVAVPAAGERNPEAFHGDGAFLAGLGLAVTELTTPAETTVARVVEAMAEVDLVHFNCHGMFSAELPLEAALMMSDGLEGPRAPADLLDPGSAKRLSARRLLPCRLRADTAVLRACSSGVTNVRVGDEVEGLLRALTHAGVGSALVSRWKIDVLSSQELVRAMYRAWLGREGVGKAVALQQAQLSFLGHQEHEYYRHPYHWAPFTFVGDWW